MLIADGQLGATLGNVSERAVARDSLACKPDPSRIMEAFTRTLA